MAKGQIRGNREIRKPKNKKEPVITRGPLDQGQTYRGWQLKDEALTGIAMTVRTTKSTVTFKHPFKLNWFDRPQPAGASRLTINKEEMAGTPFLAYRRAVTMLHTPTIFCGKPEAPS